MSFIGVQNKALDPGLTSLFASSLGPVAPPPKTRYREAPKPAPAAESSEEDQDSVSESDVSENEEEDGASESASSDSASDNGDSEAEAASEPEEPENEAALARIQASLLDEGPEMPSKKRKRGNKEDALEDVYMEKMAREEAKEEEKRSKKQKTKRSAEQTPGEERNEEESDEESFTIPKHESLMDTHDAETDEVEKASRTVFLGNVSSEAITSKSAEKKLKQHLSSFIPDLADNKPPHKVESIRYRSTAFASALPKRAAFAKKEIMDTTTKSTNAYVVYSTKVAAREAAKKLNGTVVLGRHLRVDSLAHPAKVDHRRCVFVGNLGFVDQETADDDKKKKKLPADVEEGLWIQFSKAGKVESVRVPRDPKTRVGKGFAYVQFEDENAVEAALQFNEQKFPPLLPRKLRVVRAKAQKKEKKPAAPVKASATRPKGAYNAKMSEEQSSTRGRARVMLGKAAKAGVLKSAESFVFEGHRASSKQGTSGLRLGGKKGKKKGPNGRKSRSQAWKSSGGKK